jgi:HK97 family phage major capsid protein
MTTATLPASQEEFEEALHDKDRMKVLWNEGPEAWGEFCQAYAAKAMEAKGGELGKVIGEGLQAGMADYLKANGAPASPAQLTATAQHQMRGGVRSSAQRALYNKRARGAAADGIFDDGADFFQAVALAAGRIDSRDPALRAKLGRLQEIQNSYGSEVPSSGGFLIPEHLRSDILEVSLESAVMRPRCTVIPMDSLRVPIPMIDDTSHVNSILGGIVCYWTEEAGALTESQASFGSVVLDAKKLTGYAAVPNELLADAPAFGGYFDSIFPRAIAWFEDLAFIAGTGVGEPLGYINCPASVQVAAEAGQPSQTIVWENITKMYARMLPTSLGKGVWIASIDTFPQLATMALSVGTGGGPVWIGNFAGGSGGADTPPVSILGRPVYFTEKTPALGTTGDISFVDPSYYLIGDRQQMQAMESPHYLFANDKTAFRVIERLDGRPWLQSAITPHNGSSSTLTPFVQLASR